MHLHFNGTFPIVFVLIFLRQWLSKMTSETWHVYHFFLITVKNENDVHKAEYKKEWFYSKDIWRIFDQNNLEKFSSHS